MKTGTVQIFTPGGSERQTAFRVAKTVFTNGCFDLLHSGHISLLNRMMGSFGTITPGITVGLNSDESVANLKGPGRPFICQKDRAFHLCSLSAVFEVWIFDSPRCDELIRFLKPDIYVKSGEYTSEQSLDRQEYEALKECGTTIYFTPGITGKSTSNLIERIRNGK